MGTRGVWGGVVMGEKMEKLLLSYKDSGPCDKAEASRFRCGRQLPAPPGTSQEPFLFEAGQAQSWITSHVCSFIRFLEVQYDHM